MRPIPQDITNRVIELYADGLSTQAIAPVISQEFGRKFAPSTAYGLLKKQGVKTRIRSDYPGWNKGIKTSSSSKGKAIQGIEYSELLFRSDMMYDSKARFHAKRILIAKNGYVCQICKTVTWCGQPVPLVCDHINGDSSDNRLENFRLVCGNCNMQLPTFCSKNRGRGRTTIKRNQIAH